MKPSTLLIDLDGTLVASRSAALVGGFVAQFTREMRKRYKCNTMKSLRILSSMKEQVNTPHDAVTIGARSALAFAQALDIPLADAEQSLEDMIPGIFGRLRALFRPVDGAADFVTWASKHFTLCLATNPAWDLGSVVKRLSWSGLSPELFRFISHADNMCAAKPHAAYFSQVLSHLDATPAECLMIGNCIRKDAPAAKIGVPVFLLARDGSFSTLRRNLEVFL